MEKKYVEQIAEQERVLSVWQKRFQWLGYGKLFLLALLGWALYRLYGQEWELGRILFAILTFCASVVAWLFHIRVHERVLLHKGLLEINKQYLARFCDEWRDFELTGKEYTPEDHPYAADLDITGTGSLFQMFNVAHTYHGRRAFARDILEPGYTPEEIALRQEAVTELADKTTFANEFQYYSGKIAGNEGVVGVVELLKNRGGTISPVVRGLLLWFPVALVFFTVLAVSAGVQALYIPCVILLCGQAVFWAAGYTKTSGQLSPTTALPHVFRHYVRLLELLEEQPFQSRKLQEIRQLLVEGTDNAYKAFEKLDTTISMIQAKNSGILYFVMNILFLWDYRCLVRLSDWKQRYGSRCEAWFEALGVFESLLSLSVIPNICNGTCLPVIEKEKTVVTTTQLGHPLLPNKGRVRNDFTMEQGMAIISGSNMSGKTTFLRTVGINMVLAKAGGYVCASEMRCAQFQIVSSMRVTDNLGNGISTFYAELRQVARIIQAARSNDRLFFLIDEIFRGTNSEDRLFGAAAVIRELSALGRRGLITTHDLSLCTLEQECANIRNYSFSEQYSGREMLFDYKIRRGKAQSSNARFLMKMVGILPWEKENDSALE